MTAPAAELQKAVFDALAADAALAALVGARIYDHAPANVAFPYVTFGRTSVYDWSTGTESGTRAALHAACLVEGQGQERNARDHGTRPRAAGRCNAGPRPASVSSTCGWNSPKPVIDEDLALYHGLLRFRAVTEATI